MKKPPGPLRFSLVGLRISLEIGISRICIPETKVPRQYGFRDPIDTPWFYRKQLHYFCTIRSICFRKRANGMEPEVPGRQCHRFGDDNTREFNQNRSVDKDCSNMGCLY